MAPQDQAAGEKEDLWQSILADVTQHTSTRHLETKSVLVLGDEGAGRSSLISRLADRKLNADDASQGTGLEYTYLNVKDEDTEDVISRLGVYTLDGNPDHMNLLKFVVNKETVAHTVVMVVLDMSRPWLMLESLERWFGVLDDHLATLDAADELAVLKSNLVKYYQQYSDATEKAPATEASAAEGEGEGDEAPPTAAAPAAADDDDVEVPLDEGVLVNNCGLPIIVVVNKADTTNLLEQERDYRNEHFDFIQLAVRRFCIERGAAVVYCGKDGKNKERLYRYLLHRAYGFAFNGATSIADHDSVFIPSGWDTPTRTTILHDGFKSFQPDDEFSKVIVAPVSRTAGGQKEVEAEDEQEFLRKQQPLLGKAVASSKPSTTSPRNTRRESRQATLRPKTGAPSSASKSTAPAAGSSSAAAGGAAGDNADVLANFFNSLLNKTTAPKK